MLKRFRHIVINYLTRHLLKAVTLDEILVMSSKEWMLGKHKLTQEEVIELKEEAAGFHGSMLWSLLKKDLRYGATLQRYDHAKTVDDMLFGKAMAYSIAQIEVYIKNMRTL